MIEANDKNEISLIDKNFSLEPKTLDEAMKYADLIAKSSLVPEGFRGKAGDILIAVQMGQEVGLKPLQALQNIAVINGRPTLWGDAVLAIVRASGTLEFFEESWDDTTKTATCKAKRKGDINYIIRTFSMKDAETAGLSKKPGTWQAYPKRMCQCRARAFTLRDGWADVLKGFSVTEEVMDYDAQPAAPAEPANPFLPKKIMETEIVSSVPEQSQEITNLVTPNKVWKINGHPDGRTDYFIGTSSGQVFITNDLASAKIANSALSKNLLLEIVYKETAIGLVVVKLQKAGALAKANA